MLSRQVSWYLLVRKLRASHLPRVPDPVATAALDGEGWLGVAADERSRRKLYDELVRVISPDAVETLMEYLPPVGWADVARRQDLDHLATLMRAEMDQEAAALRADVAEVAVAVRADIVALGTDLRAEVAASGGGLRLELADLRADINRELVVQTRWFLGALVAMTSVLAGLMVALR